MDGRPRGFSSGRVVDCGYVIRLIFLFWPKRAKPNHSRLFRTTAVTRVSADWLSVFRHERVRANRVVARFENNNDKNKRPPVVSVNRAHVKRSTYLHDEKAAAKPCVRAPVPTRVSDFGSDKSDKEIADKDNTARTT